MNMTHWAYGSGSGKLFLDADDGTAILKASRSDTEQLKTAFFLFGL